MFPVFLDVVVPMILVVVCVIIFLIVIFRGRLLLMFFPHFSPLEHVKFLGLSPVSEAQIHGCVLAFHVYHAMRPHSAMHGREINRVSLLDSRF